MRKFSSSINNKHNSDVTFFFEDGPVIYGHSSIINKRCKKLSEILNSSSSIQMQSKSTALIIEFTSRELFLHMIKYLYTGEINRIKPCDIYETVKLWTFLNVPGYRQLEKYVTWDNEQICVLLENAIRDNLQYMKDVCLRHVQKNFIEVIITESFGTIGIESLVEIMKLLPSSKADKIIVFSACLIWAVAYCKRGGISQSVINIRKKLNVVVKYFQFTKMTEEEFGKCALLMPDFFDEDEEISILMAIGANFRQKYSNCSNCKSNF